MAWDTDRQPQTEAGDIARIKEKDRQALEAHNERLYHSKIMDWLRLQEKKYHKEISTKVRELQRVEDEVESARISLQTCQGLIRRMDA